MSAFIVVSGLVALGLFVYLIYALFNAEDF
jgi:K+-transporting ATPase KdpF subunit